MDQNIITSADIIAMFCRLQMFSKKDLPIRSSEMGVLIYVYKQSENVTPLMISNYFQIAKPTVTAMINELVKNEYLVKYVSNSDKRSYIVSITDKGKELVMSAYQEYFKFILILEDRMGEKDFKTFINLMERANTILNEVTK
ncbi:DNA-binding transcriptional regulator, MarR family [Alkalithermobacter thermoalcaliphilus JW-YL-7 = DSM 7308]|uniref:HTH-type transcriptional regulator SarZ n=1 Tax=Alkalithermobacter thermoalcaliphilus JW-YL-7 = DSM 7308 TaxID=1121328 RepID=A0A150FNM4_CLOPD|nr:transcriptional regulator, MarR family [[Clostridium] paradoxum JW-YL-7 = DSM 7308]SHK87311.1 DNA-binding transcriptional regulator, MarR family [[Clostridium] paradoxum JW-YL-7 = DSM 7308]